jgi:Cu/Ag efflux protein CusF
MKTILTASIAALIGLLPLSALSAGEHDAHAGHMAPAAKTASEWPMSEGTIKKVDKAAGKVTVTHGPLTNLNMPAMTMVFRLKEAAWLDQMQAGGKIRFMADTVNNTLTIVRFEAVK